MRSSIHEHDFLPMGADSPFIQCRTCDTVYCILCGESMITIDTRRDHGFGKCSKYHQVIPGYEEGKGKIPARLRTRQLKNKNLDLAENHCVRKTLEYM